MTTQDIFNPVIAFDEATVKAVKEAGMTNRTIIGGAPVTQAFADPIGAGGHSADAPGRSSWSNSWWRRSEVRDPRSEDRMRACHIIFPVCAAISTIVQLQKDFLHPG